MCICMCIYIYIHMYRLLTGLTIGDSFAAALDSRISMRLQLRLVLVRCASLSAHTLLSIRLLEQAICPGLRYHRHLQMSGVGGVHDD